MAGGGYYYVRVYPERRPGESVEHMQMRLRRRAARRARRR